MFWLLKYLICFDFYVLAGDTLIKLHLTTQAGTYVKEFIHGDFGRTFPSVSFMFGQLPVDVLALDVTVSIWH